MCVLQYTVSVCGWFQTSEHRIKYIVKPGTCIRMFLLEVKKHTKCCYHFLSICMEGVLVV